MTIEKERFSTWTKEAESIGEFRVRMLLANPQWDDRLKFFHAWVSEREAARRDALEEETLSIAREANRIASRAERWAMYAAVAAVIALIISIARSQT